MGFQHLPKIVLEAASRKGGKVKTTKGIGSLPPEKRAEIASLGGKAKNDSTHTKASDEGATRVGPEPVYLEDFLTNLDELDQ